jgi:hypothetical protein
MKLHLRCISVVPSARTYDAKGKTAHMRMNPVVGLHDLYRRMTLAGGDLPSNFLEFLMAMRQKRAQGNSPKKSG